MPISLNNFTNKILSEILSLNLGRILPKSELDMSNAYDKVSWVLLMCFLKKHGSKEHFIELTLWNHFKNLVFCIC